MNRAAQLDESKAIYTNLALMGVDTSLMLTGVLATGAISAPLALAWAIVSLGSSIVDYQQAKALFGASLDPSALLLGDSHEVPSKVDLVLSVLNLVTI